VTAEAFGELRANAMTTAKPAASQSFLIMSFSLLKLIKGVECRSLSWERISIFDFNSGPTVSSE
jgi:hypothetical protein